MTLDPDCILEGLAQIDFKRPKIDLAGVEQAVRAHLAECKNASRPIRWFDSLSKAYRYVSTLRPDDRRSRKLSRELNATRKAASRALQGASLRSRAILEAPPHVMRQKSTIRRKEAAARAVRDILLRKYLEPPSAVTVHAMGRAWALNRSRTDRAFNPIDGAIRCISAMNALRRVSNLKTRGAADPINKLASVWLPMAHAATNGLFLYWITDLEIICVQRPSIFETSGSVHRQDGPAVIWASGERAWFWHGSEVPQWLIERSERIATTDIRNEPNLGARRCMVELFGIGRLVSELGGELFAQDQYGKLWRCRLDELYTAVEVENGTVEADGSRRRYFLAVPPWMRTAREAVAWTYGLAPQEYDPVLRS